MSEENFKQFLKNSLQSNIGITHQKQGIPLPSYEEPVPSDAKLIQLPRPETIKLPAVDLRQVMERRATLRKYQETALTLDEFAYLLWLTQGIKEVTRPIPETVRCVHLESTLLGAIATSMPVGNGNSIGCE